MADGDCPSLRSTTSPGSCSLFFSSHTHNILIEYCCVVSRYYDWHVGVFTYHSFRCTFARVHNMSFPSILCVSGIIIDISNNNILLTRKYHNLQFNHRRIIYMNLWTNTEIFIAFIRSYNIVVKHEYYATSTWIFWLLFVYVRTFYILTLN